MFVKTDHPNGDKEIEEWGCFPLNAMNFKWLYIHVAKQLILLFPKSYVLN